MGKRGGKAHAYKISPTSPTSPSALVSLGLFNAQLEPLLRIKAKENQKLSEGKGKQKSADLKSVPVETRVELAKAAHVSYDTIANAPGFDLRHFD